MFIKHKDKKNMMKAGIFLFVFLTLVIISIFVLTRESGIFETYINLRSRVTNAQNLRLGAAVQLKGIKIGNIKQIHFEGLDTIVITVEINSSYMELIRKDSYMSIRTQGVLGDKFLEILGGTTEKPPVENDDFLNTEESSQMEKFLKGGEDILVVAGRVLNKLDTMLGEVDNNRITSILSKVDQGMDKLNERMSHIDGKKLDRIMENLDTTAKNFGQVTTTLKDGPGTMHSLIYDRTVHDDLQTLLGGAKRSKVLNYFIKESIKSGK